MSSFSFSFFDCCLRDKWRERLHLDWRLHLNWSILKQKQANKMPNWPFLIYGEMRGGGPYNGDEERRVNLTFSDYKGLEELLTISDRYVEIPTGSMKAILDRSLRFSTHHNTAGIFFDNNGQDCIFGNQNCSDDRNKLATYLIAKAISTNTNYGFNTCADGSQAADKWRDLILGESGASLGRALLTQDMIENHGFQRFLDDPNHWLPLLENILQDEVYILGTLTKQSVSASSLPVKMKFFTLQVLGSSQIDAIADKWASVGGENMIAGARAFVTDNHLNYVGSWIDSNPYLNEVKAKCNIETKIKSKTHVGHGHVVEYIHHEWGANVRSWMFNGALTDFGLYESTDDIKNTYDEYPSIGCFLPGTRVHVDSKRQKAIEQLKENDVIIGNGGVKGVVSSERAGVIVKSSTLVYGFNDDEPFFLGSHPFWSQDGWRALCPSTAKEENPWLDIGELMQGDYVRKIADAGAAKLQYEWVKIYKINTKIYPEGTEFHGIHTREGYRTYHANGYLVFQSYPEITRQRVADGVSKLPRQEQIDVIQQLQEIEPALAKVVGTGIAEAITNAARKKSVNRPVDADAISLKDHHLPAMHLTYEGQDSEYGPYTLPGKLCILRGHLFVDGTLVPTKLVSNDKTEISWCRPTSHGNWEHGFLKTEQDGFHSRGRVALTVNKHDTNKIFSAKATGALTTDVFNTFVSSPHEVDDPDSLPSPSKAKFSAWEQFRVVEGEFQLKYKGMSRWGGLGDCIRQITKDGNCTINFDVPELLHLIIKKRRFQAKFDHCMLNFLGYTQDTFDKYARSIYHGEYSWWKGSADNTEHGDPKGSLTYNTMLEMGRLEGLKHAVHDDPADLLTAPVQHATEDLLREGCVMPSMLKQQHNAGGSLDALFAIPTPTAEGVHEAAFAKLLNCMRHYMTDAELNDILGEGRDPLNTVELKVAETFKEFLGERLKPIYLLKALSECKSMSGKIKQDEKDKLLYFLAGNAAKDSAQISSLSKDTGYIGSSNELGRLAFQELTPDLDFYMENNREDWARQLYEKLTRARELRYLVTSADESESCRMIQKQAMVLYCLAPDKGPEAGNDEGLDYSASLHCLAVMTKLKMMNDCFSGCPDLEKDMIGDTTGILRVVLQKILRKDGDYNKAVQEMLSDEVEEIQKFFKTQTLDELCSKFLEFVTAAITGSWSKPGYFWDKMFASGSDFIADHPWPEKVMKGIVHVSAMALRGMTFNFLIKLFAGFAQWPAKQKACAVLDCAKMVLVGFADAGVSVFEQFFGSFTDGVVSFDWYSEFAKVSADEGILEGLRSLVKRAGSAVAKEDLTLTQSIAKLSAKAAADLAAFEQRWSKMFALAKGAAKGLGVMAAIAAAVAVGSQIAKDVRNGKYPTDIAWECIEGASFAISVIAGAVGIDAEVAVMPWMGEVCALVGVERALVMLFVHRKPPKTGPPARKWADDVGGPFVKKKLQTPPKAWLDEYYKMHPKNC